MVDDGRLVVEVKTRRSEEVVQVWPPIFTMTNTQITSFITPSPLCSAPRWFVNPKIDAKIKPRP
jgi:hypothetical protein